jgi:hypothetical protein
MNCIFSLLNHEKECLLLGSTPHGKPLETLVLYRIESIQIQDYYFDIPESVDPKQYVQ